MGKAIFFFVLWCTWEAYGLKQGKRNEPAVSEALLKPSSRTEPQWISRETAETAETAAETVGTPVDILGTIEDRTCLFFHGMGNRDLCYSEKECSRECRERGFDTQHRVSDTLSLGSKRCRPNRRNQLMHRPYLFVLEFLKASQGEIRNGQVDDYKFYELTGQKTHLTNAERSKLIEVLHKYWGYVEEQVQSHGCRPMFISTETTMQGWDFGNLQESWCEAIAATQASVVFTHSMGGPTLAAAILNLQRNDEGKPLRKAYEIFRLTQEGSGKYTIPWQSMANAPNPEKLEGCRRVISGESKWFASQGPFMGNPLSDLLRKTYDSSIVQNGRKVMNLVGGHAHVQTAEWACSTEVVYSWCSQADPPRDEATSHNRGACSCLLVVATKYAFGSMIGTASVGFKTKDTVDKTACGWVGGLFMGLAKGAKEWESKENCRVPEKMMTTQCVCGSQVDSYFNDGMVGAWSAGVGSLGKYVSDNIPGFKIVAKPWEHRYYALAANHAAGTGMCGGTAQDPGKNELPKCYGQKNKKVQMWALAWFGEMAKLALDTENIIQRDADEEIQKQIKVINNNLDYEDDKWAQQEALNSMGDCSTAWNKLTKGAAAVKSAIGNKLKAMLG